MSQSHCACAEQTRTDLRLLRVLAHGPSGVVLPAGVVLVNIQPHFLEYCVTCYQDHTSKIWGLLEKKMYIEFFARNHIVVTP